MAPSRSDPNIGAMQPHFRLHPAPARVTRRVGAILLWTGLAALPAAAEASPTASFTASANPVAGQPVTFTSTTTATGTAPVRLAWDLDDDGAFDDGIAATVARSYPAGSHVVRLQARQTGPGPTDSVATQTILVAATAPTTPQPSTPDPAATTPTPATNLAPTAAIDRACGALIQSGPEVCLGPKAKVGVPKRFSARPSTDGDGTIVRHEWDLDGNGSFETDTGAASEATTTYLNTDPTTIRLRVTDDDGAVDTALMALEKSPASCVSLVQRDRLRATAECFRREQARSSATKPGDVTFVSEGPVSVNGVTVAPATGKRVSIQFERLFTSAKLGEEREIVEKVRVRSTGATATVRANDRDVTLDAGRINWLLSDHHLTGVELPAGAAVNGMPIAGLDGGIALPARGHASAGAWLRLPAEFGAPTSKDPVPLRAANVTGIPDLGVEGDLSAGNLPAVQKGAASKARRLAGPMSFAVPSASIGSVQLSSIVVTFDGEDLWTIKAAAAVPAPLGVSAQAEAAVRGGAFDHAAGRADFDPGIAAGPVYITHVAFRVELDPKQSECIPKTGVVDGVDYGHPTFALCGDVGLSAGPQIAGGLRAIGLNAGLGFVTFDDRPAILRAHGNLRIAEIQEVFDGALEVHTDGYINVRAKFRWGYPGWVNMSGGLGLELLGSKFNATGTVEACLAFADVCARADALVSNHGIAACLEIPTIFGTWRPGAGYRWGGSIDGYLSGCDLGPYRVAIDRATQNARRAARQGGAELGFDLPAGLPGAAIAIQGADGAPVVTLIGPKGERITTPSGRKGSLTPKGLLVADDARKLTQAALPSPSAGRWRVVAEPGSTPVTAIKTAEGLPAPKIQAMVTGRGALRTLHYDIARQPGQTVEFAERGATAGSKLGRAATAKGQLRFTPADGKAERREIVAIVRQDGELRDEITVARFRAPRVARAGRAKAIIARQHGSRVTVTFAGAPRASRHQVTLALASGQRLVAQVDGTRHTFTDVPRAARGGIEVRGVTRSGLIGRAATTRLAQR